ncbi:hypothetical protein LINGRAHAP2_LOCUS2291 [Linum grandiflorum]
MCWRQRYRVCRRRSTGLQAAVVERFTAGGGGEVTCGEGRQATG